MFIRIQEVELASHELIIAHAEMHAWLYINVPRGEQVWLELENRDQIANLGCKFRSVLFFMQDVYKWCESDGRERSILYINLP